MRYVVTDNIKRKVTIERFENVGTAFGSADCRATEWLSPSFQILVGHCRFHCRKQQVSCVFGAWVKARIVLILDTCFVQNFYLLVHVSVVVKLGWKHALFWYLWPLLDNSSALSAFLIIRWNLVFRAGCKGSGQINRYTRRGPTLCRGRELCKIPPIWLSDEPNGQNVLS